MENLIEEVKKPEVSSFSHDLPPLPKQRNIEKGVHFDPSILIN
jgi:hypothetical protein